MQSTDVSDGSRINSSKDSDRQAKLKSTQKNLQERVKHANFIIETEQEKENIDDGELDKMKTIRDQLQVMADQVKVRLQTAN
jgi:hypothetical protein